MDLTAYAILIGLGASQRHRQAILAESAIPNVQPHNFGTAECSREPEQDQGAVPNADQAHIGGFHHGLDVIC